MNGDSEEGETSAASSAAPDASPTKRVKRRRKCESCKIKDQQIAELREQLRLLKLDNNFGAPEMVVGTPLLPGGVPPFSPLLSVDLMKEKQYPNQAVSAFGSKTFSSPVHNNPELIQVGSPVPSQGGSDNLESTVKQQDEPQSSTQLSLIESLFKSDSLAAESEDSIAKVNIIPVNIPTTSLWYTAASQQLTLTPPSTHAGWYVRRINEESGSVVMIYLMIDSKMKYLGEPAVIQRGEGTRHVVRLTDVPVAWEVEQHIHLNSEPTYTLKMRTIPGSAAERIFLGTAQASLASGTTTISSSRSGKVCLHAFAGQDTVWYIQPAMNDNQVFLYRHQFPEQIQSESCHNEILNVGKIKDGMPEMYSTVSLVRNRTKTNEDAQQSAKKVLHKSLFVFRKPAALALLGLGICLEVFDSYTDIATALEYNRTGREGYALASLLILIASGVARSIVSLAIEYNGRTAFKRLSKKAVLKIFVSAFPVPIADLWEASSCLWNIYNLDPASFVILKEVRNGRTNLRSATSSAFESLPQLVLQGVAFSQTSKTGTDNSTIVILSMFVSLASIIYGVVVFLHLVLISGRGAMLQTFDLTESNLKQNLSLPPPNSIMRDMGGIQFARFMSHLSTCDFGILRFDDIQLLIDNAKDLLNSWSTNEGNFKGWKYKKMILAGCKISIYAFITSCLKRHNTGDRGAKKIVVEELTKILRPPPTGLRLLIEVALNSEKQCNRLQDIASSQPRSYGPEFNGQNGVPREVLFLGAVAGCKILDKHGAAVAAAILHTQRTIKWLVISGNNLGMSLTGDTAATHLVRGEHLDADSITREAFTAIESNNNNAVDGQFDFQDFQAAFRLCPSMHRQTLYELFNSISENGVVTLSLWLEFTRKYPNIVLTLYRRLHTGIAQLLSSVVYSSKQRLHKLQHVDLRACNLTNNELWAVLRVVLVDCHDRRIHILIEGNGSHNCASCIQQIMDAANQDVYEKNETTVVKIAVECILEGIDLLKLSNTLLDYASCRKSRGEHNLFRIQFSKEVRVSKQSWEEPTTSYDRRIGCVILDHFIGCMYNNVIVSWTGSNSLHGSVGVLLSAVSSFIEERRHKKQQQFWEKSDDITPIELLFNEYNPRIKELSVLLRLNTVLWSHGFNASCERTIEQEIDTTQIPLVIKDLRVAILKHTFMRKVEIRISDIEVDKRELTIIVEIAEAMERHGLDAKRKIPLISLKKCRLDSSHTKSIVRFIELGVRYINISGNSFGPMDLLQFLFAIPKNGKFACLDLSDNLRLASLKSDDDVVKKINEFRRDNPEVMLCLPPINQQAVQMNWTRQGFASSAFTKYNNSSSMIASPHLLDNSTSEQYPTGLSQWRSSRKLFYETAPLAQIPSIDHLPATLNDWRSPKGPLWNPRIIQQLVLDCKLITTRESNRNNPQPNDVVIPLYMYTVRLNKDFLWAMGVSSKGHRFGKSWRVMKRDVTSLLEESRDEAGQTTVVLQLKLPHNLLEELGIGNTASWTRQELSPGLQLFSCGIIKLIRYENRFAGDAGLSPFHDTVLWIPSPNEFDNDSTLQKIPPSGVIEYISSHLPEEHIGGKHWHKGVLSISAAGKSDTDVMTTDEYWKGIPVFDDNFNDLCQSCFIEPNPLKFNKQIYSAFCTIADLHMDLSDSDRTALTELLTFIPPDLQSKNQTGSILRGKVKKMVFTPSEIARRLQVHLLHISKGSRYLIGPTANETCMHVRRLDLKNDDPIIELDDTAIGINPGTPPDIAMRPTDLLHRDEIDVGLLHVSHSGFPVKNSSFGLAPAATTLGGLRRARKRIRHPTKRRKTIRVLQRLADENFEQPQDVITHTMQSLFKGNGTTAAIKCEGEVYESTMSVESSLRNQQHNLSTKFLKPGTDAPEIFWSQSHKCNTDDVNGMWLLSSCGSDVRPLRELVHQLSYDRNAWMLAQVKTLVYCVKTALSLLDASAAMDLAPYITESYSKVPKIRKDSTKYSFSHNGVVFWGHFAEARDGQVQGPVVDTTTYMLHGRSTKLIAPWSRKAKLLQSIFNFDAIWWVSSALSPSLQQYLSDERQSVVELVEVSKVEALIKYTEACTATAQRNADTDLQFSFNLQAEMARRVPFCYVSTPQGIKADDCKLIDVFKTSVLKFSAAPAALLRARSAAVEIILQFADVMIGFDVPLSELIKEVKTLGSNDSIIQAIVTILSNAHDILGFGK